MTSLDPQTQTHELRRQRLAILARASLDELQQTIDGHAPGLRYEFLRRPEPGMVMLRGRIGGTGDAFNLGEATVTRCAIRLSDGRTGTGYVLGRERRKSELVAVLDALLQPGQGVAGIDDTAVKAMQARQAHRRAQKAGLSGSTKVEFFTLVRGE